MRIGLQTRRITFVNCKIESEATGFSFLCFGAFPLAATFTQDALFSLHSPCHAFDTLLHQTSGSQCLSNLTLSRCSYLFYKKNCMPNCPSGLLHHSTNFWRFSSSENAQGAIIKCWASGTEGAAGPFLVCPSCKSVQPLDSSVNYFQIFSL